MAKSFDAILKKVRGVTEEQIDDSLGELTFDEIRILLKHFSCSVNEITEKIGKYLGSR